MSKRGENVYKRKDGRWEGRYFVIKEGKKKYVSVYAKTCAEVRQKLLAGRQNAAQQTKALPEQDMTMQALFERWLQRKKLTIKPSSYARYHELLRLHVLPKLGDCQLKELTAQKLDIFLTQKLSEGRRDKRGGLAGKTVADMLCIIKSAVKMAAARFYIPQAFELLAVQMPAAPRAAKPQIFSRRECIRLSRYAMEEKQAGAVAVLFCLNTGLRLGEACALRWSDIDFAERTLVVQRTAQRFSQNGRSELSLQSPKTAAGKRTIPLTADMLRLLQKQPRREYVFGGSKPLEPRTLQYRFAALLKKCGLPARNFHALRHTFASRFVAAGGDVKSLSEILGHANVRTTMQLYVHPTIEQKRTNMELICTLHDHNCA